MSGDRGNRILKIIKLLENEYPDAKTALKFTNPLELLVATILSAQCTDERVNKVAKALFMKYRTARDYADAPIEELMEDVRPTGFYKNKARSIKGACKMVTEEFGGSVPCTMDELTKLPGVARKTANVVLQNGCGVIAGIVVDTHVMRLAGRLGLTEEKDRNKIESDLMSALPVKYWMRFSDLLVWHGRAVCRARKPMCERCVLKKLCQHSNSDI